MKYHLFISHAWKYSDQYRTVISWLDSAPYFDYCNYSVPSHNPIIDPSSYGGKKVLQDALTNQIKPASKVIILSGMYAAHSDWINFEIETAINFGKTIIGVRPRGQERIPTIITQNAEIMVNWNSKSLIDAIKNY